MKIVIDCSNAFTEDGDQVTHDEVVEMVDYARAMMGPRGFVVTLEETP